MRVVYLADSICREAKKGFEGLESRARSAGFSVMEIGNRKECLHDYASFPGFLPLNPLRTPSPPLKRAGTPCTRERGLRPGLTALRGASEGWGYVREFFVLRL